LYGLQNRKQIDFYPSFLSATSCAGENINKSLLELLLPLANQMKNDNFANTFHLFLKAKSP
jgi:hypothetical protein